MKRLNTAHDCPFCFFLDDFQLINSIQFGNLLLFLLFFRILILWPISLIFGILHDDKFLQVLHLFTHAANHLILPLYLLLQLIQFSLKRTFLLEYLGLVVIAYFHDRPLGHALEVSHLTEDLADDFSIGLDQFNFSRYHGLLCPVYPPFCETMLLDLVLKMSNDFLYAYHNVDFIINLKFYQLLFEDFQPFKDENLLPQKFQDAR